MTYSTIGAVTGANKGIGLAIVRQLALQYPKSSSNPGPFLIYLLSRDKTRGEEALHQIQNDQDLKRAKALKSEGGLSEIKYHSLDIISSKSIDDFAGFIKKEHPDGIDFVINNAGIAMEGFNENVVKKTLECNYHGTLNAIKAFLPILKPTGRIVNLSSIVGSLGRYSPSLQDRFRNPSSVEDITKLMDEFTASVVEGRESETGFPSAAYAVSKAGITGMTKILAKQEKEKGHGYLINACHPGWVRTDMTKGRGVKSIDQGAQTPVLLAIQDINEKTGEYWSDEKIEDW